MGLMAIEHSRLLIHNPPPVWMVKPLNVIYSWWLTYRQESTNSLYITSYIYIYTLLLFHPPAPSTSSRGSERTSLAFVQSSSSKHACARERCKWAPQANGRPFWDLQMDKQLLKSNMYCKTVTIHLRTTIVVLP